jgi:hypothetical protein
MLARAARVLWLDRGRRILYLAGRGGDPRTRHKEEVSMGRKAFLALVVVLLLVTAIPAFAEDSGPRGQREGVSTTGVPTGDGAGVAASAAGPSALTDVDTSATTAYMWSNLYRTSSTVYSEGWTSGSNYLYWVKNKNHLCKRNTCSKWGVNSGYNVRWLWDGWYWNSTTWCVWRTNTEHRFKFNSGSAIVTRKTVLKANF